MGDHLTTIEGGMSRLADGMKDQVLQQGVPIRFGAEVTGLSLLPDNRVRIQFQQHGQIVQKVCDSVLCALPFSVLRQIRLEGFSRSKYDAINNIHYVSPFKMLLNCQQRFWEQDHYGLVEKASFPCWY